VYSIAEKLQKKWAIVQLSIPTIPTKKFPFVGFAFFNAPWYNLLTYRLIRNIYWRLNKKDINDHRKTLGLQGLRESIIKKIAEQNILNLYALSPSLISRPEDWKENADITGFLTIPPAKRKLNPTEQPAVELIKWLQDGEPPVYIGFGSIPIPDTRKFAAILAEMISTTTHRFIFCEGWSELKDIPQHPRLFTLRSVNHQWLFPQCKTAIIHGGIGTVAAVLSAKIPVIIVSIFGDQPMWGKIITDRKLGIHIPFKQLTRLKTLDAIKKSQTPKIKGNALETGEAINREDGLKSMIHALENYFA
jgi:sterol 3beta-glucosyltransferase